MTRITDAEVEAFASACCIDLNPLMIRKGLEAAAATRPAPKADGEPRGCPTPGACSCLPMGEAVELAKLLRRGAADMATLLAAADLLAAQAAEIERLKLQLDTSMAGIKQATRAMEILDTEWRDKNAAALAAKDARIVELEAALRQISQPRSYGYQSLDQVKEIARAALASAGKGVEL